MGKIRKVERKGFPFCSQREGNFDCTGHLSWTVSLVSSHHVTGWFTLSARSLERWCQQGLELLGSRGKSVLAPPSGLGNLPAHRRKADGGLQLCFVILFQMLVISSAVSSSLFSLPFFFSLSSLFFLHFFQLCSCVQPFYSPKINSGLIFGNMWTRSHGLLPWFQFWTWWICTSGSNRKSLGFGVYKTSINSSSTITGCRLGASDFTSVNLPNLICKLTFIPTSEGHWEDWMNYEEKSREADEDQIVLGYVSHAERSDLMSVLWKAGQWHDKCSHKITLASGESGLRWGQVRVEADGPARRRALEKGDGPLRSDDGRNSWGLRCGRGKERVWSSRSPRMRGRGAHPRAWQGTAHMDRSCRVLTGYPLSTWKKEGDHVCWMREYPGVGQVPPQLFLWSWCALTIYPFRPQLLEAGWAESSKAWNVVVSSLDSHHDTILDDTGPLTGAVCLNRVRTKWKLPQSWIWGGLGNLRASLIPQMVKNPPAVQETQVQSLGWEDPLEKEMATLSSILVWRIPWTEELGGLWESEQHSSNLGTLVARLLEGSQDPTPEHLPGRSQGVRAPGNLSFESFQETLSWVGWRFPRDSCSGSFLLTSYFFIEGNQFGGSISSSCS